MAEHGGTARVRGDATAAHQGFRNHARSRRQPASPPRVVRRQPVLREGVDDLPRRQRPVRRRGEPALRARRDDLVAIIGNDYGSEPDRLDDLYRLGGVLAKRLQPNAARFGCMLSLGNPPSFASSRQSTRQGRARHNGPAGCQRRPDSVNPKTPYLPGSIAVYLVMRSQTQVLPSRGGQSRHPVSPARPVGPCGQKNNGPPVYSAAAQRPAM